MRLLLKIGSENEEQKRAKKGCKNHSKSNSFCVYVCCRTQSFKNAINDCILNSSPLFHWFSIIAKIYMHLERFVHLQNWSKCCIRCTFVKKDLHFETNVVIHELSCSPKMFHPLKASFFSGCGSSDFMGKQSLEQLEMWSLGTNRTKSPNIHRK